jgi:hypothetical protein
VVPGGSCNASELYGQVVNGMKCMYWVWTTDGPEVAPGSSCTTPGDVRLTTDSGKEIYWAKCTGGVWASFTPPTR